MKTTNLEFHGFDSDAAKRSSKIKKILNRLIAGVESDIKIVTSTPKFEKRMEISFSKHYNFQITMDHDSGYISHHQESNCDSSSENINDMARDAPSRPIYFSEDALLEKPEIFAKTERISAKIMDEEFKIFNNDLKREDLSQSRNILFPSPDTILSSSVRSQLTSYSEFDDTDSNISIEIPYSKQIIVNNVGTSVKDCNVRCNNLDSNLCRNNSGLDYHEFSENDTEIEVENKSYGSLNAEDDCTFSGNISKFVEGTKNVALNNITNTLKNKESGKRLTLIFSKNNKENVYSVKRKYHSLSPEKDCEENKSFNPNLASEKIHMPLCGDMENGNEEINESQRLHNIYSNKYHNLESRQSPIHFSKNKIEEVNNISNGESPIKNMILNKELDSDEIIQPENISKNEIEEENGINDSGNPIKNMILKEELDSDEIIIQPENIYKNEIEALNDVNNSGSPGKNIILCKELDLDKIVVEPENIKYADEENKKVLDLKTNRLRGPLEFVEQYLTATPRKKFQNTIDPNVSPDLFEHEETVEEANKECQSMNYIPEEKYVVRKDQRIVKRAQNSLKGVLPPHSVTVVQMSVDEILNRLETNKEYFWTHKVETADDSEDKLNVSEETLVMGESKSLLITGNEDCLKTEWPSILLQRFHGLHYNRSKLSEEFEELCLKYGQRYVGAETQSSCTIFGTNVISPTKRRQTKQRWAVKSPGRRLSHLAKRRITFSGANLQGAASSSFLGSRARQILVDAKKLDLLNRRRSPRKSPRKNLRRTPRKTPSKSPRLSSRTPSSSAKKKLAMRFRELAGEIEKTVPCTSSEKSVILSKRVLFQSPEHEKKSNIFQPSTSGLSMYENELKKPTTKRALFLSPSKRSPLKKSPFKRSPFKRLDLGDEKKRKRSDWDDAPPSKLSRSLSMDIRSSECDKTSKVNRTRSDMNISLNRTQPSSGELSAVHKQKLQWAVYEALRSQNITSTHPQFKVFASVLARVTRRFLPNLSVKGPKECGTTEKMLRIARIHVYAVIKGKSVDEIINEYLKNRTRSARPQGYVGLDALRNEKNLVTSTSTSTGQNRLDTRDSLDKKKLEQLSKPKVVIENRIDRIRKVINFGDDNR